MTKAPDWWLNRIYPLPLIVFSLLILLDYGLWAFLFYRPARVAPETGATLHFDWQDPLDDTQAAAREATGRFILEATVLLLVVVACVVLARCFYVASRLWPAVNPGRRLALVVLTALALVLYLAVWFVPSLVGVDPFWYSSLPGKLYSAATQQVQMPSLVWVSTGTYLLTYTALIFVALVTGLGMAKGPPADLSLLADDTRQLRELFYLGAALMVIFVVETGSELLWAASLLQAGKGGEGEAVNKLALGAALNLGVYGVTLLLAIHLPAVWVLTTTVRNAVAVLKPDAPERQESWLTQQGLASSTTQYLTQVVTVLSPLWAGFPLAKLVEYLVG
jgi:hypothetical protein